MERFSFVVTNYNYERYLEQCLTPLSRQDYDPALYEIVCIDDGSTDNSWKLIQSFQSHIKNLVSLKINNSGLEKACNTGIRQSRFERIIRVDADDIVAENLLSTMNRAIQEHPGFDFYYCRDYVEFYSDQEQVKKKVPDFDVEEIFSRGDFFATGTVYKKSDLEAVGYFPESVKNCGLENYSVILDLISRGKKGLPVSGTYFKYRRHHSNMSIVKLNAIIEYGRNLLKRHGREFQTNQYHPYNLKLQNA